MREEIQRLASCEANTICDGPDAPWSKGERWLRRRLCATKRVWRRRAPGAFWHDRLGIMVVLVSGDLASPLNESALHARGALILRVSEFEEIDAEDALRAIKFAEPWNRRRRELGLPRVG